MGPPGSELSVAVDATEAVAEILAQLVSIGFVGVICLIILAGRRALDWILNAIS